MSVPIIKRIDGPESKEVFIYWLGNILKLTKHEKDIRSCRLSRDEAQIFITTKRPGLNPETQILEVDPSESCLELMADIVLEILRRKERTTR